MRITEVQERTVTLSRYSDRSIASGRLTTSLIAVVTDVVRGGRPIVGLGFASVGRFGQCGLLRERFIPRILAAPDEAFRHSSENNIDPFRVWNVMMAGEKAGGHGERCVAVGAVDMALWDASAKISDEPLHVHLRRRLGRRETGPRRVPVYGAGGYPYPNEDLFRLSDEIRRFREVGFERVKIKVGASSLDADLRRIDLAVAGMGSSEKVAIDAMNSYSAETAELAGTAFGKMNLWWFEDFCDPLDFDTHRRMAGMYPGALATGEALFSLAEAKLLQSYGGLRQGKDVLVFDPVHCYGLPGFMEILNYLVSRGWPRSAFWPHGGHLFCLHLVAALDLGGAEVNPFGFQPFCGLPSSLLGGLGFAELPEAPGIGFELRADTRSAYKTAFPGLLDDRVR